MNRARSRIVCAQRPGGTLSSLGVYSGHLTIPLDAFAAGLGDHRIVTTLCPGGKERMRRLMSIVAANRFPFRDLVTHSFRLEQNRGSLRPVLAPTRRSDEGRATPIRRFIVISLSQSPQLADDGQTQVRPTCPISDPTHRRCPSAKGNQR